MTDPPESDELPLAASNADPCRDPGAHLEGLFDDCRDELLGTLYYVVGNLEDARDALQESFLKCWNRRHQIGDVENLRAWIFRVTLNTGRDLRKTAWNRRRKTLSEDYSMASTAESPTGGLEKNEELERLRHAVAQLPPDQQEVFLLRQNGQLSYPQIAEAMSIPLGTVKTRMRTAIRSLRQTVGDLS